MVSIVIPCYNSQNTIVRALNSVIDQTYTNYEIIIVDDFSQDDTIKLIEQFIIENRTIEIRILKQSINKGASFARNRGIENAKGNLIALLDSDDFFHPQKLEIINNIFNKYKYIDMLGHSFTINRIEENIVFNKKIKKVKCYKLLLKNFAVTPSIVFKNKIQMKFNENMRYTEDHDFFIRACYKNYKIYYIDLPLVALNRELLSKGGQSSNNIKMRIGEIKMYLNLYKINLKFIFIIPLLVSFSILKHIIKKIKIISAKESKKNEKN